MESPTPQITPLLEDDHHHHHQPMIDDTIEPCLDKLGSTQLLQAFLASLAWFFDAQQTFISVFTDADPKSTSTTSIISEWTLGPVLIGLPASSFFLGNLVGGLALATLADTTLGRKKMLVLSSLLMSLTGVLTAASMNIWMYISLRFMNGFCRATVGTSALVLCTESVGKKWREHIGIVGFICFSLGFASLPLLAFSLQGSSWRLMYVFTCVPSLVYSFLVYFLVSESPRWLFIKGRKDELPNTLSPATNRSSITESFLGRFSRESSHVFSSLKILVRSRWAFRRLLAVVVLAFGIGMIYYGMPLALGSLSFNLYLSVALNALSEFPASILTFFLIGKMNRKGSLLGLTTMSGICSVGCGLVGGKGLRIVLELVSFFSACTAFDVVLIYSLELFPTCVRNSAVSLVRQAMVLAGALCPVLLAKGRKNLVLEFGVFGVTIWVCGMFVMWLPETRGRILWDRVEEDDEEGSG